MSDQPRKAVQLSNTVIIGGLFVIAGVLAVQEFVSSGGIGKGTAAPDVAVTRLDGRKLPLSSLRGQVVLLNFWATWCPPCNEEMPDLVKVARAYEAKGVVFLAANLEDPEEAREAVPFWLQSHAEVRPFVVYAGPDVGDLYRVEALPTTYVLDRSGKVAHFARGQVADWQVREWLDDVLGGDH